MSKSKLTKALTLLFSVTLVVFFLLYRTGTFESDAIANEFQQSPNGGVLANASRDTSGPAINDSLTRIRMKAIADSLKKSKQTKPIFFSGSKSGRVFEPVLKFKPVPKIDTTTIKKLMKKPKRQ